MDRRNLFTAAFATVGGLFAVKAATAAVPDKQKVVYHLSDADKVQFVLGNIQNHFEGVGGPEHVTIALVVHGPALKAFQTANTSPDMTKRVAGFSNAGLEMNACGNTMKGMNIGLNDLLPGFISADKGGVVRLAELQAQGFVYLRP
jgi:uncharacterized protein